jgi:Cu/Ag efflux protein CusF
MQKYLAFGLAVLVLALFGSNLAAEQGTEKKSEAAQTKVGVVKNVDLEGKKVVVAVARELTFSVSDGTKISRRGAAKKLADVKAGARVKVEYTRTGDDRVAVSIAILGDEEKK